MFFFQETRNPYNTNFKNAEDWDEDKTKFKSHLVLKSSSYKPYRLFSVKTAENISKTISLDMEEEYCSLSPSGRYRYTEVKLPKGKCLDLISGRRLGTVCFDGDVSIPRVNERKEKCFRTAPWMSLTPMEMLTQRAGVRRAKGHVIIAGLGLGWLLKKVDARKNVKRITLVEISQEMIDWILPRLTLAKPLEVICGDAKKIVPDLTADVALTDIDEGYGGNRFPYCPNIPVVWTWGTAYCC